MGTVRSSACAPLHFVVLDDELLFEHLDGVHLARLVVLHEHDLRQLKDGQNEFPV